MTKKSKKKKMKLAERKHHQNGDDEIMVDGRLHRLREISHQVESLRNEVERLLQSFLPDKKPELSFVDHKRRISWTGGSVKLGKKSYLFVKTIWLGENHQVEFSELEESVWKKQLDEKMFISPQTVCMLVRHTQNNLAEANFPYEIESIKNSSSRELEGFRLVSQIARKES
jgi:hypothetical protein